MVHGHNPITLCMSVSHGRARGYDLCLNNSFIYLLNSLSSYQHLDESWYLYVYSNCKVVCLCPATLVMRPNILELNRCFSCGRTISLFTPIISRRYTIKFGLSILRFTPCDIKQYIKTKMSRLIYQSPICTF